MTQDSSALAIEGGMPLSTAPWPEPPVLQPASEVYPVDALEAALAAYLDLPSGAVVAFGEAGEAYRAVLGVAGLADGREALVPTLFANRAAEAAQGVGWRVVPGELEADTGALSSRWLAQASERAGLVVVAHPFGHPAPMTDLVRVAEARGVPVIEEISGALGAAYRGMPVGRIGRAAVLAGRAGDPLSRGTYAILPNADAGNVVRGWRTSALDDLDAAIALAEMRALDEELLWRRRLAWEITLGLRGMRALSSMPHGRWVQHAYSRYVVRLRPGLWKRSLDETVRALRAEGIPCEAACGTPLHRDASLMSLPESGGVGEDMHPVGTRLPNELIAIPLHSGLTSKETDLVVVALRKVEARSV